MSRKTTFIATGDAFMTRRLPEGGYPGFDEVQSIIKQHDVRFNNLEITLRLKDLLSLLGYDTLLIRDSDISVYTKGETIGQKKVSDLKERVRMVNETPNAFLISIHQNHFSGFHKYYGGGCRVA